jgi:hypothetical protein
MFPKDEKNDFGDDNIFDPDIKREFSSLIEICIVRGGEQDKLDVEELEGELGSYGLKDGFSIDVLKRETRDFALHHEEARQVVEKFLNMSSKTSILSVIIHWAQNIGRDRIIGKRYLSLMKDLISSKAFKKLQVPFTNQFVNLWCLALCPNHFQDVINAIRMNENWTMEKREECVSLFCEFTCWLSKETFGYISELRDFDRDVTKTRRIKYDDYVKLIQNMELREQIITKLLYICGLKDIEHILKVKIEQIDYMLNNQMHVNGEIVSIPAHLSKDIRKYAGSRSEGYLFLGKTGERISSSTPLRVLRTISKKLGMDNISSFRDLTKNR